MSAEKSVEPWLIVHICLERLQHVIFGIVSVRLTVFWDVNSPLCGSALILVHTGEVLALMKGQAELVSQSGFQELAVLLQFHGGLAFGLSGQKPEEVDADAWPSVATHCNPERRVFLSLYWHTHQVGSWKRKQEVTGRDRQPCQLVWDPLRAKTYCARQVLFSSLVLSGSDVPRSSSNFGQNIRKTGSVQNSGLTPNHQPGVLAAIGYWCFCRCFRRARLRLQRERRCARSTPTLCIPRRFPTRWESRRWCSGELWEKGELKHREWWWGGGMKTQQLDINILLPDSRNAPQTGRVTLLRSTSSNAGWFITHVATRSQGEQAGRSRTPLTVWLPLGEEVKLNQEASDAPSGRSQDMLAAGTPSAAEHSITPSSVCRSTVGETVGGGAERRLDVGISLEWDAWNHESGRLTQVRALRFNGDVELQACLNVVIGDQTVVEAGVLKPHLTPNCQVAADNL